MRLLGWEQQQRSSRSSNGCYAAHALLGRAAAGLRFSCTALPMLTSPMFGGLGTRHQGVLPLRNAPAACTCSAGLHQQQVKERSGKRVDGSDDCCTRSSSRAS